MDSISQADIPQADISQTDKDFEQFVCAACHNLRQSLRNLRLLVEDAPDSRVEEQICAMESTLKGMVEYSVACVSEGRHDRVEMEDVLKQVLLPLDSNTISHDPLPAVLGDASQLATVLRHLLDNAVKFHGADAPRIHISAKRDGPRWILAVRDNGPGIESPYRERVFTPFKRLHGHDYPGNGLGLAICRKLIERHGGRIWVESNVESNPGSGTAVLFSLTSPQS
jgi:signal transduction histidine kinase